MFISVSGNLRKNILHLLINFPDVFLFIEAGCDDRDELLHPLLSSLKKVILFENVRKQQDIFIFRCARNGHGG